MFLRKQEHEVLVEALRRRSRFGDNPTGGKGITDQWTGLGCASEYKQAVQSGLMELATNPNPGYMTWWRLTHKGATIVSYWMGCGFTHDEIERGKIPSPNVTDLVS